MTGGQQQGMVGTGYEMDMGMGGMGGYDAQHMQAAQHMQSQQEYYGYATADYVAGAEGYGAPFSPHGGQGSYGYMQAQQQPGQQPQYFPQHAGGYGAPQSPAAVLHPGGLLEVTSMQPSPQQQSQQHRTERSHKLSVEEPRDKRQGQGQGQGQEQPTRRYSEWRPGQQQQQQQQQQPPGQ